MKIFTTIIVLLSVLTSFAASKSETEKLEKSTIVSPKFNTENPEDVNTKEVEALKNISSAASSHLPIHAGNEATKATHVSKREKRMRTPAQRCYSSGSPLNRVGWMFTY